MSFKALIWNIRSVRTHHFFHRIRILHRFHKFDLIYKIEPFQEVRQVQQYKRRLGVIYSKYNLNGKICLFMNSGINVEVVADLHQQLIIKKIFDNVHQMIETLVLLNVLLLKGWNYGRTFIFWLMICTCPAFGGRVRGFKCDNGC